MASGLELLNVLAAIPRDRLEEIRISEDLMRRLRAQTTDTGIKRLQERGRFNSRTETTTRGRAT